MRPVVPDALPQRSRKPSLTNLSSSPLLTESQHASPETFFLSRDDDVAAMNGRDLNDSSYGVQSLEETLNETTATESSSAPAVEVPLPPAASSQTHESSTEHIADTSWSPHLHPPPHNNTPEHKRIPSRYCPTDVPISLPLTPLGLGSPAQPISFPSSPKSTSTRSFRQHPEDISLPDETNSHAVASSDDDDDGDVGHPALSSSQSQIHASDPQLIMPSIRMPSRRPFTDRGKSIGSLKIMIAGGPGSGKTSLLKAIVQHAQDIVHVDPLPRHSLYQDSQAGKQSGQKSRRGRNQQRKDRRLISEIYASTKPYSAWWSDLEDSRVLRRRKSLGDVVLERNLCFVDNEAGSKSRAEYTEALVQYMKQQWQRALRAVNTVNSPDLQNMLSGNGGSQVDVILYLVSEDTLSDDIESMRKLAQFSNVVPLIPRADILSEDETSSLKQRILDKASDAGIQLFLFRDSSGGLSESDKTKLSAPFTVSSANTSDNETMDASVLMSSDYIQPLAPSELESLIDKLFDRDNLAWLRHLAAKKLIQAHQQSSSHHLLMGSSSHSNYYNTPSPHSGNRTSSPGYTLARVSDHTHREEQLAQIHLAKWATDLQRSLQNERERYASLTRHERAVWLTERLSECVVDGTLIPLTETPGFLSNGSGSSILTLHNKEGRRVKYHVVDSSHPQDPLGLLSWNEKLLRNGWILVQVVGTVGAVGGLAFLTRGFFLPKLIGLDTGMV